jgi:DNA transformation protein and related proteins
MALNEEFKDFVMGQLEGMEGVTVKKMFGGGGIFHDGKMFALLHEAQMFLKVDDSNKGKFKEAGTGPFKPHPNKPMKMPYYEVPPEVLEDQEKLKEWAGISVKVAHG